MEHFEKKSISEVYAELVTDIEKNAATPES